MAVIAGDGWRGFGDVGHSGLWSRGLLVFCFVFRHSVSDGAV